MLLTYKITGQVYIFGNGCGESTTVERYPGGTLTVGIVGDWLMGAVSIGRWNIEHCTRIWTVCVLHVLC